MQVLVALETAEGEFRHRVAVLLGVGAALHSTQGNWRERGRPGSACVIERQERGRGRSLGVVSVYLVGKVGNSIPWGKESV